MDTNPEPDTQFDPCPQLRPLRSLSQSLPFGCDFPLGPNPNPKLGFQASVPRYLAHRPYQLGTSDPRQRNGLPPRRKQYYLTLALDCRILSPGAWPPGPTNLGHMTHGRGLGLPPRRKPYCLLLHQILRAGEICHALLRTPTPEAALVATNMETDTLPDPRPPLSTLWCSLGPLQFDPQRPIGPKPNPWLGFQASVP